MSLKDPKYDAVYKQTLEKIAAVGRVPAEFIGVDLATKTDVTVVSMSCGNCGVYRRIDDHLIMEKCPNCGDDETDLSLPTIYDQDARRAEPNENQRPDQDPKIHPDP